MMARTCVQYSLYPIVVLSVYIFLYRRFLSKIDVKQNQYSDHTLRKRDGLRDVRDFKVLWYNPPIFLKTRPDTMFSGFSGCAYSNCKMSYNTSGARDSDVVIFTGRTFPTNLPFVRPLGQVWIFYENEPPYRYSELNTRWNQSNVFNWTMTYDKSNADIYLPYGEIKARSEHNYIDIQTIMEKKNRRALIVLSDCDTPSERVKYIEELKKYIEVDVLGKCGTEWSCGARLFHDGCFELLNKYKFYLAFENSFCNNYFTEKIFENFDYDTVLVSRGGIKGQSREILPNGTFISTEDFRNAKILGSYLKSMSLDTYVNILKRKKQYTSLNSYTSVFRNAMCEICLRMNNIDKFRKTITDMNKLVFASKPCRKPSDL